VPVGTDPAPGWASDEPVGTFEFDVTPASALDMEPEPPATQRFVFDPLGEDTGEHVR
jgi:hypothetical protein